MSAAIEVENLVKNYVGKRGNKLALNKLSLSVPEGSILGLLGPNGAGKSTLINILAGTVVKNSGVVKICGKDIDVSPKLARSLIGIVPQEVVIDSFFSLEQSLEFTAGYYGIRPAMRRSAQILKDLDLYDKRNSLPKQLSGGMRRRFLVAKAMAHGPKVLILDEPTAGVDIDLRARLKELVKELNKQGTTVIITTHYLEEAMELCDNIAFISAGKIVADDSKKNLLKNLGSRHLDVEFDGVAFDATTDLSKARLNINRAYSVIDSNILRFPLSTDKNDFNELFAEINRLGLVIKDLKMTEPDLEDIFRKVMAQNKDAADFTGAAPLL